MFRRLHEITMPVSLSINGEAFTAQAGDMVGAALLVAGVTHFRTSAKSGSARGLYCGMGVCFECLVTIDGIPNRQACLTPVAEGMQVVTGAAAPDISARSAP